MAIRAGGALKTSAIKASIARAAGVVALAPTYATQIRGIGITRGAVSASGMASDVSVIAWGALNACCLRRQIRKEACGAERAVL